MGTQAEEWVTAARLLRRSGFGTTGTEVDKIAATDNLESVVEKILAASPSEDSGAAATPMPKVALLKHPGKTASGDRINAYRKELSQQMHELTRWWVRRMVAVEQPTREKLTLLWHNHFATSAEKVQKAALMAAQNEKLRTLCLGDFETLAYAMLTDAAMVVWLDGDENKVGAPNENLAREFLELFALGHGNGYSETDVREGARALTGWIIREDGNTTLHKKRHDPATKTVLGSTGKLDAKLFCQTVLEHQGSPRYVASRLWQQLASDTPPSGQTLDRLVGAYGSDRNLQSLTAAILTDAEFLESRATVVSGPVDWLIGLLRTLQVPVDGSREVAGLTAVLKSLGQRPFYPPNVGGWPRGRAWLSTAAVGIRLQTASSAVKRGDISVVVDAAPSERLDAVGYLIGVGAWTDSTIKALKPLLKDPPTLVAAAVNTPEYLTA